MVFILKGSKNFMAEMVHCFGGDIDPLICDVGSRPWTWEYIFQLNSGKGIHRETRDLTMWLLHHHCDLTYRKISEIFKLGHARVVGARCAEINRKLQSAERLAKIKRRIEGHLLAWSVKCEAWPHFYSFKNSGDRGVFVRRNEVLYPLDPW